MGNGQEGLPLAGSRSGQILCWVLADSTLRQNPPQLRADLRFRLRRYNNLTMLPNTSVVAASTPRLPMRSAITR